jgi:hypothetical protein
MTIMEVTIARFWSLFQNKLLLYLKLKTLNIRYKIHNIFNKIKRQIAPSTKEQDNFEAACDIIIDKYKLQKLKSPFSGHIYFYTQGGIIWQIDKTEVSGDPIFKLPKQETQEAIRFYNNLPKSNSSRLTKSLTTQPYLLLRG